MIGSPLEPQRVDPVLFFHELGSFSGFTEILWKRQITSELLDDHFLSYDPYC